MNDLRLIIPSRNRLRQIGVSSKLLPTATIVVAESERDAYANVVGASRLVTHPGKRGFAGVFNWCIDTFTESMLFFMDDDVTDVKVTFPRGRRLIPEEIETIIENGFQAIADLGMTVHCFARTANIVLSDPQNYPIRPVQPVCVAFGVTGAARRRRYDESLVGRGDVDWTLRTLRDDRAVYCDCRFFFANGRVFGGEGGNVGIVDARQFHAASAELKRRWGRYVTDEPPPYAKTRTVVPMRLRVSRTNPTATK